MATKQDHGKGSPISDGQKKQLKYFFESTTKNVFEVYLATNPSLSGAQHLLSRGDELKEFIIRKTLELGAKNEMFSWTLFYKKHFGIDADFSGTIIPKKPKGSDWWLIYIPKGMTMNKAYARCRKLFPVREETEDLDEGFRNHSRTTDKAYAVWVYVGTEPQAKYLGKSAEQADPFMKIGMTILEALILEIKYFSETLDHLNVKGFSICSGSSDWSGGIAYVSYTGGKFGLYRYSKTQLYPGGGIRSAVGI